MPVAAGPKSLDRAVLWLILAAPLGVQTWRFAADQIYYGEYLHWTGQWGARLLLATLLVSALRRFMPRARTTLWLSRRRRDLGLVTFAFAAAHVVAYVWRKGDIGLIVTEALDAGLATGWVAGIVFLALALTSNDASVRRLGRRWHALHRFVYPAAVLTFAHWVLTAFDPTAGWLHAVALLALLLLRLDLRRQRSPGP
ncbi:MAG: ferric reductase-like transmembrane domain-containing protein [Pseudomonadota bacterium]